MLLLENQRPETEVRNMTFSDLAVGQTASLQKTFTEADIATFAEISLDSNPIHLSDEYAKKPSSARGWSTVY